MFNTWRDGPTLAVPPRMHLLPSLPRHFAVAALALASMAACEPGPLDAADANRYETCTYDDSTDAPPPVCADGQTRCLPTPHHHQSFCSVECSRHDDCPTLAGAVVLCERFTRSSGLCVVRCDPDGDDTCPQGTECNAQERVADDAEEVGVCIAIEVTW